MFLLYFLLYFIIFVLSIALLFKAYIKIKMPFWQAQPVFHYYDFLYWLKPPGLIQLALPRTFNKYLNLIDIQTWNVLALLPLQKKEWVEFIGANYVQSEKAVYKPGENHLMAYLSSPNQPAYVSFYHENLKKKDLVACSSARPLNVTLRDGKSFATYYVDNLCVQADQRKKGLAPIMIQTQCYNLRQLNPKIQTCLFKREGALTAIVPLTTFETFCFDCSLGDDTSPPTTVFMPPLIEIGLNQLPLFMEFIKNQQPHFSCIVMPDLGTLMELIKTENIVIYGQYGHGHGHATQTRSVVAVYIFRQTGLSYSGKNALECFLTVKNKQQEESIFIHGFYQALQKTQRKWTASILLLENTAHSHYLVAGLKQKTKLLFKSPTAFFFYNYACYTVPSKAMLILY